MSEEADRVHVEEQHDRHLCRVQASAGFVIRKSKSTLNNKGAMGSGRSLCQARGARYFHVTQHCKSPANQEMNRIVYYKANFASLRQWVKISFIRKAGY